MRCMQDDGAAELKTRRETPMASLARRSRGGVILAASILIHLLFLAPLLFFLTPPPQEAEPVESVSVELVPPPELEPEAEEQEESQAQAEPPAAAEPPPEPDPQPVEEPQAEPPVPPAEEPPVEEPPPAEEPPAEEAPAPSEPEPELPAGAAAPIPVLRPVVQFGERDSGTNLSREGAADGTSDGEAAETEEPPEPDAPAEDPAAEAENEPSLAAPELALPEADAAGNGAQDAPVETLSPSGETISVSAEEVREAALKPRDVARLFSTAISDDPLAMTAMGMMSRQERGDQLCGTELSQQLRHGRPGYVPYLLPILRIGESTVADVPLAAFQDIDGRWINIAVRCEVDADATRVVDFSLSVGAAVPRAEWRARGFPVQ